MWWYVNNYGVKGPYDSESDAVDNNEHVKNEKDLSVVEALDEQSAVKEAIQYRSGLQKYYDANFKVKFGFAYTYAVYIENRHFAFDDIDKLLEFMGPITAPYTTEVIGDLLVIEIKEERS
jgi:hypothetical protein